MLAERALLDRLATERACLFLPTGELLWRSPAWLANPKRPGAATEVNQTRWQEFIALPDLPVLLDFLAAGGEGVVEFCSMVPATGKPVRVAWWKTPWQGKVLVLGDVIPCECAVPYETIGDCMADRLPAPSCFVP
jgi:hypothetical protein